MWQKYAKLSVYQRKMAKITTVLSFFCIFAEINHNYS